MRENKLAVAIFSILLLVAIGIIYFVLNNNQSNQGNVLGDSDITLKVTSIIDGLKYNEDGTVTIKYIYTIKNPYTEKVTNLKATSNLKSSFNEFPFKVLGLSSDNLSINQSFNGESVIDLLISGSTLQAQTTAKVYLDVQLNPLGSMGPFNNSVRAEGELAGPSTSAKSGSGSSTSTATSTSKNTNTTPTGNTSKAPTGSTSGTSTKNTGSTPKPAPTTGTGVGSGSTTTKNTTTTTKPKPTNTGSTTSTGTSTTTKPTSTSSGSVSGTNSQTSTSTQSGSKSKPMVLGLATVSFTLQSFESNLGSAGLVLASTTTSSSSEVLTDTNFEINPVTLASIIGIGLSIFSFKRLNKLSLQNN